MPKKIYLPLLEIEKVLPILNKISIFGGLNDMQLYKVFRLLETVEYQAGEIIFRKGEQPAHIYIIETGRVELLLEGTRAVFERAIFEVGQCFGESAVIGIQPHTATAVALAACQLIVLSRRALMAFYEDDPALFGILILNIARETCRRLNQTDEILLHYFLGA
jgi:CRP/FNR family transcriptional regulator, cyclic AMP receptor protein